MVVKIGVPFWVLIIIRHLIFRGCPKRGHNFDNYPSGSTSCDSGFCICLVLGSFRDEYVLFASAQAVLAVSREQLHLPGLLSKQLVQLRMWCLV